MKRILLGFLAFLFVQGFAQKYQYKVDLTTIKDNRLRVELACPGISTDEIVFSFPACIPGTYMWFNYGMLIDDLKAYDNSGNSLRTKKISQNSYRISKAKGLSRITYSTEKSFGLVKCGKLHRCAGTSFEEGKSFLLNAPGVFGFFEGLEKLPVELDFVKPGTLMGYTSLKKVSAGNGFEEFTARDYHQLIDSPILFALPDTSSFVVGKCRVTVVAYDGTGVKYADTIATQLKPKLIAIEKFLGTLPVDHYTYLVYLDDYVELKKQYDAGNVSKLKMLDLVRRGVDKEGALEHGNSSVYYYVDSGKKSFIPKIINAGVHEFLHIIVPLNLHSNRIGEFNYTRPEMSKYLWLYEGVTEYFNSLSQLQGKELSMKDYLDKIRNKIVSGSAFPVSEMSFAEFSENIMDQKVNKLFSQVYSRGAVLGLLLDAEIIRLTDAHKTLKDVVLKLSSKYNESNSFDEDSFIHEFVNEVHPDLQLFFDNYITGRVDWDLSNGLKTIGIEYVAEGSEVGVPVVREMKDKTPDQQRFFNRWIGQ